MKAPAGFVAAGLLVGLLGLGACSGAQEKRLADGSWQIRCGETMQRCASRADLLCGDSGYEVVGGGTQGRVLGGPNGYRTRVQASELVVRCGSEVGSQPAAEAPRPSPETLHRAPSQCIPGATQACVGPGGCSGGQACREDGAGFGPCDCGGEPPPSSSTPPVPGATPPAPVSPEPPADPPVQQQETEATTPSGTAL